MNELLRLTVSLMLICPLMASIVIVLMHRRVGPKGSEAISICMGALSVLMALLLWYQIISLEAPRGYAMMYRWVHVYPLQVVMGVWLDRLSACMAFMVAMIAWFVQIYSIGYMKNDPGYVRYFTLISFFTGSMLVLVMSSNMIQMFFAWEAMSIASYALIGFWYEKESASLASFKAIMINRFGDYCLLMGILLWGIWGGSWSVADVLSADVLGLLTMGQLYWITSLMLVGVMIKSAQIPFHIWLPSAMEAPTSISALIHAATMVIAGVFWILRFSTLFSHVLYLNYFLMFMGSLGALWMAIIACNQDNIKSVMAYSTLSQLGVMIAATGSRSYNLVLFHLFTHAYTKAMIFLAVGQVIYCMHSEQRMSAMGGLGKRLPITLVIVFLGSLSMVGVPPLSGFWSKDTIVHVFWDNADCFHQLCAWMLIASTGVSAAYMTRVIKMVFFGPLETEPRHAESLNGMTVILLVLLVPSLFLGLWLTDAMLDIRYWNFMPDISIQSSLFLEDTQTMLLNAWFKPSVYIAPLGSMLAWNVDYLVKYLPNIVIRFWMGMSNGGLKINDWYVYISKTLFALGEKIAMIDDVFFQKHCVLAIGRGVLSLSSVMKVFMNGKLGRYIEGMGLGMGVMIVLVLCQHVGWRR